MPLRHPRAPRDRRHRERLLDHRGRRGERDLVRRGRHRRGPHRGDRRWRRLLRRPAHRAVCRGPDRHPPHRGAQRRQLPRPLGGLPRWPPRSDGARAADQRGLRRTRDGPVDRLRGRLRSPRDRRLGVRELDHRAHAPDRGQLRGARDRPGADRLLRWRLGAGVHGALGGVRRWLVRHPPRPRAARRHLHGAVPGGRPQRRGARRGRDDDDHRDAGRPREPLRRGAGRFLERGFRSDGLGRDAPGDLDLERRPGEREHLLCGRDRSGADPLPPADRHRLQRGRRSR